jgi:hypothetical protein
MLTGIVILNIIDLMGTPHTIEARIIVSTPCGVFCLLGGAISSYVTISNKTKREERSKS